MTKADPKRAEAKLVMAQLDAAIAAAKRKQRVVLAAKDQLEFVRLLMPDPEGQKAGDIMATRFRDTPFHRYLAGRLALVARRKARFMALSCPPQHGKRIDDQCPVLTTKGWKRHGELAVGDEVFTPAGHPSKVLWVSPEGTSDLLVEITDGARIIADRGHLWRVHHRPSRTWRTVTTQEMLDEGLWSGAQGARGSRAKFQLPTVSAIEMPDALLPVHPYVLGAWLGDGSTSKPRITHHANDSAVISAIAACGYEPSRVYVHATTGAHDTEFRFGSLWPHLKLAGVAGRKHIPDAYFTASRTQRLELLAGMIDTDGYVHHASRRVCVSGVDRCLIEQFAIIVRSLGWRATIAEFAPVVSSSGIAGKRPTFQLTFSPDGPIPTRLERKRIEGFSVKDRKLAIRSITPCDPVPSRCIGIEDEGHVYLVGEHLTPTHNSLLTGDTFIPWFIGQHPEANVIYASYSEDRSREVGNVVKGHFLDPVFGEVFPGVELRSDSKAADQMMTNKGGRLAFIGRKGAGTGKPCDLLVVDDPIKGNDEARSPAILKELHEWWDTVLETRCHSKTQRLVIQTRWTLDDLIGRLCDPNHPDFDPTLAMRWDYVNIPAVVTDPQHAAEIGLTLAPPDDWLMDAWELALVKAEFGDRPMCTLWPERFDLPYMALRRRKNPRAFEALSMGNPTPDDGAFFPEASIVTYASPADLPKGMLYYGASDHAIGEKKQNDPACAGIVGVDADDNIWVLPDLAWDRLGPDRLVAAIVSRIQSHKPLSWFGEADLIGKTLGPALRKAMMDGNAYAMLVPIPVQGDKEAKAANAQARAALGKIRLPAFAPWFERAKAEMMRFPAGKHDDFVDFLGILCRGLDSIRGGKAPTVVEKPSEAFGTIGWIMADARRKDAAAKAHATLI